MPTASCAASATRCSDLEAKIDAARANADAALNFNSVTTDSAAGDAASAVEGESAEDGETTEEAPAVEEETEHESFNPNRKDAQRPPAKPRSVAPAPARSGRERVAEALRDRSLRSKTTDAIAAMAKVSLGEATTILQDLEAGGKAKKLATADGKVFWKAA